MFTTFFYLLRARGINVSLNEWLTLHDALQKGLARSSLTGFYYLCRSVLVHSEADFDKYDQAFLEYFQGIEFTREIPQEVLDWLNKPLSAEELEALPMLPADIESYEEILKMLAERLEEQTEEHNGGNYWVGTQGTSRFGNNGKQPGGVRVGGQSKFRSAFYVAGQRKFRDFREDKVLDNRSFQMALKSLRQFSAHIDAPRTELNLDESIQETGKNAGNLKLVFDKPRKNAVKLLLLMDSGGSMDYYHTLCKEFFSAVKKSNHFKDLSIYYFHNCVSSYLYTTPVLRSKERVETSWVMNNLGSDYKVIIIGDAEMAMWELQHSDYYYSHLDDTTPPIEWVRRLRAHYPRLVWMTPQEEEPQPGGYWGQSYFVIRREVPMYKLTIEGLQEAFKRLMVAR